MKRAAFTIAYVAFLVSLLPGAGVAASPPTSSAAPAITGVATEGSALSVSTGTWTGTGTVTYTYQWLRCGYAGSPCLLLAGATSATYTLAATDAGSTIRAVVTAKDSEGTNSVSSAATSEVTGLPAADGITQPDGKISIPPTSIAAPHRILIDLVEAPAKVRAGTTFTLRVHVSDTRSYVVRGLEARTSSVAESSSLPAKDVKTAADGWATFKVAAPKQKRGSFRLKVSVWYLAAGSAADAEPLLYAERIVIIPLLAALKSG